MLLPEFRREKTVITLPACLISHICLRLAVSDQYDVNRQHVLHPPFNFKKNCNWRHYTKRDIASQNFDILIFVVCRRGLLGNQTGKGAMGQNRGVPARFYSNRARKKTRRIGKEQKNKKHYSYKYKLNIV
jgi:hypothetical protein